MLVKLVSWYISQKTLLQPKNSSSFLYHNSVLLISIGKLQQYCRLCWKSELFPFWTHIKYRHFIALCGNLELQKCVSRLRCISIAASIPFEQGRAINTSVWNFRRFFLTGRRKSQEIFKEITLSFILFENIFGKRSFKACSVT